MTITIDNITDEDIELYLYSFQLHQFLREETKVTLTPRGITAQTAQVVQNNPFDDLFSLAEPATTNHSEPHKSTDADLYIAFSMYYENFYADRIKDGDTIRWQIINKNFDVSRSIPLSGLVRDPDVHKVIHNYVESLDEITKAIYKSYILRILMFGLFYRANKSIETDKKILLYPFVRHSTLLIVPHIKQVRYGIGTNFVYTVGEEEITVLNRREDIIFKIKPIAYSDICHHRIDVAVYGDLCEYICEHYPNKEYRIDYDALAKFSTRITRPKRSPQKVGKPIMEVCISDVKEDIDDELPF